MFNVSVLPPGTIIESVLSGFFDVAEVEAYADVAEAAIRRCARLPGGYRMLIDVSACQIQSQVVLGAFAEHIARVPRADRLAVVTGSSIMRMQIRRLLGRPYTSLFADRDEALAWLTDPTVTLSVA